jgi:hypothetical protein
LIFRLKNFGRISSDLGEFPQISKFFGLKMDEIHLLSILDLFDDQQFLKGRSANFFVYYCEWTCPDRYTA